MNEEIDEKKRQRNIRIVSWTIILLMVLSVGGYYIGSAAEGNVQRYHGIKFTASSAGVLATVQGVRYAFNYFPSQVEGIPTDAAVAPALQSPFLFLTYDPSSNYSESMAALQYYVSDIFSRQFNAYVAPSVTHNASYNLPIVTCLNATQSEPVLAITESNETAIRLMGNCISVTVTNQDDVFRVQDKLLFLRLGVMDR